MDKPVLLTDCDGVLLQWLAHTPKFVEQLGFDSSHLKDALNGNQYIPFFDIFCANNEIEAMERLRQYNESEFMRSLPVIEDQAIEVVERISNKFDIIVVTSISDSPLTYQYRKENLEVHYGDSITDLICLPPDADKSEILNELAESRDVRMWLDDQVRHVHPGIQAGIPSYQFTYGMDCGRNTGEVPEMSSWLKVEQCLFESKPQPQFNKKRLRTF